MKIAFLARFLDLKNGGGSSRSLHLLASELAIRGHDVDVYITHKIDGLSEAEYEYKQISNFEDINSLLTRFKKISKIQSETLDKYDIAHIFNPAFLAPVGHSIGNDTCDESDTVYVGRLNTYTLFCSNLSQMDGECHKNCTIAKKYRHSDKENMENLARIPRYISQKYLEKRMISHLDMLFAISPQVKNIYLEYGLENEIVVVPNFTEDMKPNYTNRNNKDNFRILYVGRLVPQKGVKLLLDALGTISDPIHLDIIGDGAERNELIQHSQKLNDRHKIVFHGWMEHDKISKYYNLADLFIHPGLWPEPFGRTIMESLQHNCPILTSNTGAPPWIAGKAGETFIRGDHKSLSNKIQYLIKNGTKLSEMRNACTDQINKFSTKKVVNDIESLYQTALSNKGTV